MEFYRAKRRRPFLNVTSLIDVQFLLLIFFMVSSTFVEQPNIKLELPRATHAEVSDIESLTVTITQTAQIYFRDRPVAKGDLPALLLAEVTKQGNRSLVIKADKNVPHGRVIEVLDIAKGVGFTRIVLPTSLDEPTEQEKE
jgi:biopolymer transport protein ExbD